VTYPDIIAILSLFVVQLALNLSYIFLAIVLVLTAIVVGPYIFKFRGYKINDSKEIKLSDAIGFFLQALLAVVIAFVAIKR
jgi:hypothetical protein